jgi:hypothetical protein
MTFSIPDRRWGGLHGDAKAAAAATHRPFGAKVRSVIGGSKATGCELFWAPRDVGSARTHSGMIGRA